MPSIEADSHISLSDKYMAPIGFLWPWQGSVHHRPGSECPDSKLKFETVDVSLTEVTEPGIVQQACGVRQSTVSRRNCLSESIAIDSSPTFQSEVSQEMAASGRYFDREAVTMDPKNWTRK